MAIQAQLYPNNLVSSFCNNGYYVGPVDSQFNSQQKHHLSEFYNRRDGPVDPNLHVSDSKALNSPIIAIQLEKQWEETDQYIRFQNEKLRYELQEQGKQHVASLLKKLESRSLHILREKDEEIAKAARKRLELEEYLRNLEAENRKWQRVAQEKETMALALYKTLEDMREGGYCSNNGVVANDAESFCDETGGSHGIEEKNKGGVNKFEQITRGVMLCKSCHSRESCYLFLPCRHLASCKVCNAFLEACPVCRTPKKASVETLIF
ncbi:probable BOI-related E3 ubiquitin-protein ligase 3 [Abrus precatorius]|uniref:Probable BOI-related E3 ubiquitin-protein ligase 3 n=1 Tax=Abrus precatorius TaxID=3816 RepID=A0A8B8LKB7_ABRPR|nr:probable BOI-related E3 ubiquitin-protein ligase 3 [Abrus precatorius]